jgi:hypothetical protein
MFSQPVAIILAYVSGKVPHREDREIGEVFIVSLQTSRERLVT